ncbi:hypothetical protein ALO_03306 [Acetonema longum DSM 6540]|uniref:Uncharacterized protein n=1 Tax=Acetonema longum DSM 6540 TaxID=1009370 RepID=F7NF36_9FIRM|nr:hypothetical protein ALO_03306 [Acetonema longum DSM 6540]
MQGKSNACVAVLVKNLGDFSAYEKSSTTYLPEKSQILIQRDEDARADSTFERVRQARARRRLK